MLVDVPAPVCYNFGFSRTQMPVNSTPPPPPNLIGNINSPIKFINCATFPENKTGKCISHFITGRRCHLAWRVLTLADEYYRGEPHEILVKCLICTQKKKVNSERYFKIFYALVNL